MQIKADKSMVNDSKKKRELAVSAHKDCKRSAHAQEQPI
jgi:hypothetical protein